ncbi:MAG TPA: hypothetical protein VJK53_01015 [Candidatus Paceibacterota bacterium]
MALLLTGRCAGPRHTSIQCAESKKGALAYVTFPSGAETEVFVEECKEGKRPAAIDQWKVQMDITDDQP